MHRIFFQVLPANMAALALTSPAHIGVTVYPDSGADVARSTSTNASRILAKMRVLASTSAAVFVAFVCPVSSDLFFDH